MSTETWEKLAAKKRQDLLNAISDWLVPEDQLPPPSQDAVADWPESSSWFTKEELEITGWTALELLHKLSSGDLMAETVTRAFLKRAVAAQQLTKCLTETCFERAISTAKELDRRFAEDGPVGPLHGLPISLKDNFNLPGLDSTIGLTSHIGAPSKQESVLVEILRKAGAVFYVKTNIPTAIMIVETVNNIFGRTVNPLNRKLTSGGSSGGESALIAFKGSPCGIGTDVGGSLRIPAACTGIFTLKPSFGRFPTSLCQSCMSGQEAVQTVNGPLTRTLADLELLCQIIVKAEPWHRDPHCLPVPWRAVSLPPKLTIAVMWDDGMVRPTPPVKRALEYTVGKLQGLKRSGNAETIVEIIEWSPEDEPAGLDLLHRMFAADGGRSIRTELERTGEPWRPEMAVYKNANEIGGYAYWQLNHERQVFQKRYLDRWIRAGIDAILCPSSPYSSVENGKFKHVSFTGVSNVLDYSCISFPTGVNVDKSIDKPYGEAYEPLTELDREIQSAYNVETVNGMPINLQLVAQRLEEEKCVEMCKMVLKALE
ncbi:amidase [Camillea tinctor]|nr:amidase [Camillea tinctor]